MMKTLTVSAFLVSLAVSGSAFASSSFWGENSELLDRYSNPNDSSQVRASSSDRLGTQPAVGSTGRSISIESSNFWYEYGNILERNSNPNDDSYKSGYSAAIGSQPEVGSASGDYNVMSTHDFWSKYGDILERRHNPAK
jgi:hypothetical protein